MILGIMGPGRSGKDEAAEWFVKNRGLRYSGTTSVAISKRVAELEDISFEEAHSVRHERREYWRWLGDQMREDDPAALARIVREGSDMLVGVRAKVELKQVRKEKLCDLIIWIDRPGIPIDPTIEFGPELCDIIIPNWWGLREYHERLKILSKSLKL